MVPKQKPPVFICNFDTWNITWTFIPGIFISVFYLVRVLRVSEELKSLLQSLRWRNIALFKLLRTDWSRREAFFRQKNYEVWVTKSARILKVGCIGKFMGILNSTKCYPYVFQHISAMRWGWCFFYAPKRMGMIMACTAPKVENWNWKTSTRKRAKQFIGCVGLWVGWRGFKKQKLFVFLWAKIMIKKLIKWFICFWKFHSALAKQAVAVFNFFSCRPNPCAEAISYGGGRKVRFSGFRQIVDSIDTLDRMIW